MGNLSLWVQCRKIESTLGNWILLWHGESNWTTMHVINMISVGWVEGGCDRGPLWGKSVQHILFRLNQVIFFNKI